VPENKKDVKPDRKLGDEWLDWDGDIRKYQGEINERKRLFFAFALLSIFLLAVLGFIVWYLITPRLASIHYLLPYFVGGAMAAGFALICLWFAFLTLSVLLGRDLVIYWGKRKVSLNPFLPVVVGLGKFFGISRDRMGSSFVKASNALLQVTYARWFRSKRLLLLLPRCLEKSIIKELRQLAAEYGVKLAIVGGGEKAREVISNERPDAVIGVACERDLVLGIKDVLPKVPVIGIANKRPNGPCKDTLVDVEDVEQAIRFFLKNEVRRSSAR